jgi:hypothetical protein
VNTIAAWTPRAARARLLAGRAATWLEAKPTSLVLAFAVVVEWLAVLGLALKVHHNGWIYYQGGDQLWYYSLGWLLSHGHLWQTPVGYLWSFWLAPIAHFAGPNVAAAMPAVVLLNVLVLLPAAMLAVYGIAARIGGRVFGYWTLLVWIAVPFIGIRYTLQGYHMRYSEAVLPQGFGLTAMADFPAMVAVIVALYFCARVALDASPRLTDAVAGGVAFGAAIALKPSVALVLLGPPLAFLARRRVDAIACLVGGLLPALAALTFWKERGLGQVPLLGASGARAPAGVAGVAPVLGLDVGKYFRQDSWSHLTNNIDLLREHFWSGHGAVWLVIAGMIAIGLRSRIALLLIGGSFLPFTIAKGAFVGTIDDTATFRYLIPAFPMFVLGVASLVYLVPGTRRTRPTYEPAGRALSKRLRIALLGLAVVLTAVVPVAATAAASRSGPGRAAILTATTMPVPVGIDIGLHATVGRGSVVLMWRPQHPAGGTVFYRVSRLGKTGGDGLSCQVIGAQVCTLSWQEIGVSQTASIHDTPGHGTFTYRVGVAANWLNDPNQGDIFLTSPGLRVHVP